MSDDEKVIEIRTYSVHANAAEKFARVMADKAVPMMTAAGLKVLSFDRCVAEPATFVLVRAFDSLRDRDQQKEAFYGSAAWKDGVEDEVMSCIHTYLTAVVRPSLCAKWT